MCNTEIHYIESCQKCYFLNSYWQCKIDKKLKLRIEHFNKIHKNCPLKKKSIQISVKNY